MIDPDQAALTAGIALSEPLIIRTIAFDLPTFDYLKLIQRKLECWVRRHIGNTEAIKYLIHSHPEVKVSGDGC